MTDWICLSRALNKNLIRGSYVIKLYLSVGISDLERSMDFSTRVIGMKKLQTLNLRHRQ